MKKRFELLSHLVLGTPKPTDPSIDPDLDEVIKRVTSVSKVLDDLQENSSKQKNTRLIDRLLIQIHKLQKSDSIFYYQEIAPGMKRAVNFKSTDPIQPGMKHEIQLRQLSSLVSEARAKLRIISETLVISPKELIPIIDKRQMIEQGITKALINIELEFKVLSILTMNQNETIENDTTLSVTEKAKEKLLFAKIIHVKLHENNCKFHWLLQQPQSISQTSNLLDKSRIQEIKEIIKTIDDAVRDTLTKTSDYVDPKQTLDELNDHLDTYVRDNVRNDVRKTDPGFAELGAAFAQYIQQELAEQERQKQAKVKMEAETFNKEMWQAVKEPLKALCEFHKSIDEDPDFFKSVNPENTIQQSFKTLHRIFTQCVMIINKYPLLKDDAVSEQTLEDTKKMMDGILESCRPIINMLNQKDQEKYVAEYNALELLLNPDSERHQNYHSMD